MNPDQFGKLKSKNHSVFRLMYHIVLTIKYRHKILTPEMLNDLEQILGKLARKWECELIEFGGEADHVHLLIDAHPNLNLSDFVKNLKSVSSRRMRKEYADYLQQYLWGGEFWHDAFSVISVGGRANIETLLQYIENQRKPKTPHRR